ncbi:putative sodium/metabolite cotransporter BASS4, chloroplastic [Zea mays]|uniref:Putative sodium/metabolite cotransporter BASS4, chloroplastic n=1 Tax=Zea mays TaxID=4577 RepID=A0A3L6EDB3_MAIZE|nr:putative sodium/metabolite cotransporter BASS4, chloroplastic [Zea mays]
MVSYHPSLLRPSVLIAQASGIGRCPTLRLPFHPRRLRGATSPAASARRRRWSSLAGNVGGDGGKRAVPPPAALLDFARSNFLPLGLTLRTKELGTALEAWPAGLYGLGSVLLFTPFLSQFIMQVQFSPREFITGLAIFCCMPTTLSSGVILTQLVGGNSALALAMTVASNLLGIIIVPLSLARYIGTGAGVSLPTEKLFRSLVTRLLIPLIIGKVAREASKGIADFVDGNQQGFSVGNAVLLSLVPWIQVSKSRSLILSVQVEAFAAAITVGVYVYLLSLSK